MGSSLSDGTGDGKSTGDSTGNGDSSGGTTGDEKSTGNPTGDGDSTGGAAADLAHVCVIETEGVRLRISKSKSCTWRLRRSSSRSKFRGSSRISRSSRCKSRKVTNRKRNKMSRNGSGYSLDVNSVKPSPRQTSAKRSKLGVLSWRRHN